MATLLLVLIYAAFISLGLPDSVLGSAWPSMHGGLGVPVDAAGIISMVVAGGTVVSSAASGKVVARLGPGGTTALSVLLTAAALLGFAAAGSFLPLVLLAVPLGIGAGSVDAALNGFVALHYKARHMSWLHCFWGIGASAGPLIMASSLAAGRGWNAGYLAIGLVQSGLVLALLAALPLWARHKATAAGAGAANERIGFKRALGLPAMKANLLAFFCYCSLEAFVGLWAASYLVGARGVDPVAAAGLAGVFYAGITAGRFAAGFAAIKLRGRTMVRVGQALVALGLVALLLPLKDAVLPGLVLVGLGCAPVYPSLLHDTPRRYPAAFSQSIMGFQMAAAYLGTTLMPPAFGALAALAGFGLLPWFALGLVTLMTILAEFVSARTGSGLPAGA